MNSFDENLRRIVGAEGLLTEPDELLVFECDGLTHYKARPRAVVFPRSTDEVAAVVRVLSRAGVSFAPRGAGTGLSGGALALAEGVVIELARMRRLLKLDAENRLAVVETGMINAQLSRAAAPFGLHYVPDPSSQATCTIGGNIAENAGGIHCLKYGMTVDHVAAARVVLADGEVVDLTNGEGGAAGYDLLGLFIGSEGTFGIATEATVKLTPLAPAVRTLLADFTDVDDASRAVSAIIAEGLIPAALEMVDGATIRAVEASVFAAGLPADAEAALLVELDGLVAGIDEEAARVEAICRANGARGVRLARDEHERKRLWSARKGAFGAMGRISPDIMLQDAVVPRSRLPEVLAATYRIGAKYRLRLANVFHAGDGNLHPFICFDARDPSEVGRVHEAGREIMETCVRAGGTITGEHGVGLDKSAYLPLIFSDADLETMLKLRAAFDPAGICNPGKIIPTPRTCAEARPVLRRTDAVRIDAATQRHADATTQRREDAATQRRGDAATGRHGEAAMLERSDAATPERRETQTQTDDRQPLEHDGDESSLHPQSPASQIQSAGRHSPPHAQASRLSHSQSQDSQTPSPHRRVAASPRRHLHALPPENALAGIVGAEHVGVFSFADGREAFTAAPASEEEAVELLRLAAEAGWAVVPAGACSWLDVGRPFGRAVNLVVKTSRMSRLVEHEPADLLATAEAGITLDALNRSLARAGQWLPLDPPDDGRSTIGGVVSTGLAGAQGFSYGAPRAHVLGMRVALADGTVVKAGGRVVKNVAGYDMCKLFAGSYGTLGLILQLTFKLRPRPASQATLLARADAAAPLLEAGRALLSAPFLPAAVELLSPRMAQAVGASDETDAHALLVRFAGTESVVSDQLDRAQAMLQANRSIGFTNVLTDDAALWRKFASSALAETPTLAPQEERPLASQEGQAHTSPKDRRLTSQEDRRLGSLEGCLLAWRASARPTELGALLSALSNEYETAGESSLWHAGLGDGRLRVVETVVRDAETIVSKLETMRAAAHASGGKLTVESAPAAVKRAFETWDIAPASARLMRRIKEQLDPADLFSPGRFA